MSGGLPKTEAELRAWLKQCEADLVAALAIIRAARGALPKRRPGRPAGTGTGPYPAAIAKKRAIYDEWLAAGRPRLRDFGAAKGVSFRRIQQILSADERYKNDRAAHGFGSRL